MIKKAQIPKRYLFVFGTFLLSVLLYIDRVCISIAKEPMASELHLTDKQMGWVLSSFALGYALFQVPSGILADRFGPRRILTLIVTFWSIFTSLTGLAWNYFSALSFRFLFGIGEAGAFPGIARSVYSWIPLKERGLVTGINFSGSRLGAAFTLPAVAWIVSTFGWRTSFVILGVIGLLWAIFWYFWFRDDPTEKSNISQEELKYILKNRQQKETKNIIVKSLPIPVILKSKNMWLLMIQYFASNFTFFFCLTWLFPFLKSKFQLGTIEAAFYSSAPLIAGAIGQWFSGWLVDVIYKQNKWKLSRHLPAMIGFTFAAIGLIGSVMVDSIGYSVLLLSIAIFGADMTLSPSWSTCVDIGKEHAGAVSGTMNMAGNIGSFITALAFPYLQFWTGSVIPFFFIGSILNIIAIVLWKFIQPEKDIQLF